MSRIINPAERAKILDLAATGATLAMIMRETGRGRKSIERLGIRACNSPRCGSRLQYLGVETKMNKLADELADGATLAEAGRAIGISTRTACTMFARMRKQLGWGMV